MISVYSISLGCPKNRVDTERLLGALPILRPVEELGEAACVLINTCGFIGSAVEESIRVILETIQDIKELPHSKPLLVVAGCLVGRYGIDRLAEELPEVGLWLDNRDLSTWSERLAKALAYAREASGGERFITPGASWAWLKISDGCDHSCSFCTIPAIRGPYRSTPAEELETEAKSLLARGVKELILVGQDTTAWGKDLGCRHGLASLLERLLPLDGLLRLRILYLYPAGLSRDLLGFLRQAGPPFVPYFDVPLQHAHPSVLSRMGRPFACNPHNAVERIREFFPDAALRTSLIAGFPGETEKQFAALTDFVRETQFMHVGVFAFQAEEGTPAGGMPRQRGEKVKQARRDTLMQIQREISENMLSRYVGQRMELLVDGPHPEWPGLYTARTWFQAPDIDGISYVSGPGVQAGAVIDADIVESHAYDLTALA